MVPSRSHCRLFFGVAIVTIAVVYAASIVTSMRRFRELHMTMSFTESTSFMAPRSNAKSLGLDNNIDTVPPVPPSPPSPPSVSNKSTPIIPEPNDYYSTPLPNIVEFERQERVVIATKIHGPNMSFILEQMLCLLTKAYNARMQYDVVVFTSEAWTEEQIKVIQAVGAPAKVTIVKDNPGLQTMVEELSPVRKAKFLKRCDLKTPEDIANLNFYTICPEPPLGAQKLSYTWQCEFRSWHLWKRPELAPYKTMLWMDTDGFCTNVWDRDPIAYFIKHKLAIFFDNWPQGASKGQVYQERFQKAFNRSLCSVGLEDGHLKAGGSANCSIYNKVPSVHGFFHITDLDFFRSDPVMHWAETLIGDGFLARRFDDQLAVTAPTAILAPNRSWDMYSHGFRLNVYHNFVLDGKRHRQVGGFKKYWALNGQNFTEAHGVCKITAGS